jgi:hypothetical protein
MGLPQTLRSLVTRREVLVHRRVTPRRTRRVAKAPSSRTIQPRIFTLTTEVCNGSIDKMDNVPLCLLLVTADPFRSRGCRYTAHLACISIKIFIHQSWHHTDPRMDAGLCTSSLSPAGWYADRQIFHFSFVVLPPDVLNRADKRRVWRSANQKLMKSGSNQSVAVIGVQLSGTKLSAFSMSGSLQN